MKEVSIMTAKRIGSKRLLRDLNQNIVLGLIAEQGPLSRTDLARLCGLPGATITQIVGDFVAAGLVSEVTSQESSGGRRPILLSIRADAGYAVAVKLRENGMTLTVCDLTCTVIHHREDALPLGALPLAERQFGVGRDVTDFLLVTIGRGVGLGIVVGGEIYRGARGGAGEFGHIIVDTAPDAPLCNCGKRGCLEAVASDYGILRAVTGADPGHSVEDAIGALVDRALAGDTGIQAVFAHAGTVLGIAIANLINIFDPALIVLGGEGVRAGELILGPLRTAIPQYIFGRSDADIALTILQTNEVNWARGAASLVLHEVFRPPIYESETRPLIDDLLAVNGSRR